MLKLLLGDQNARKLKRYQPIISEINLLEEDISPLSDDHLRSKTQHFKDLLAKAGDLESQLPLLDQILPEAFAVVREASRRVLGMRHFDVQLIGGIVLHEGQIAEMKTGEGKTLVATLPSYLNALTGRGVHVVTVNDYLARRDAEWMGQVHRFLGLSVGLIQQDMRPEERRRNYNCDITYATNSELGFDYLRDNMAADISEVVQREFQYCVIDEVDSILIDEARTPLIISGQVERPQEIALGEHDQVAAVDDFAHMPGELLAPAGRLRTVLIERHQLLQVMTGCARVIFLVLARYRQRGALRALVSSLRSSMPGRSRRCSAYFGNVAAPESVMVSTPDCR